MAFVTSVRCFNKTVFLCLLLLGSDYVSLLGSVLFFKSWITLPYRDLKETRLWRFVIKEDECEIVFCNGTVVIYVPVRSSVCTI
jgi:hypothetical protein